MRFYLTAIMMLLTTTSTIAQTPNTVDLADQADTVGEISNKVRGALALRSKLIIDGEYSATTSVVGAREIIFKPNSKIVFNDSTANTASAFFVVADKITVEDPSNPGVITWIKSSHPAPADRGNAPSGPPGAGQGASGGVGGSGAVGNPGLIGEDAPSISIFVRTIENGGLVIDAVGETGGIGGIGQTGGQGGPGSQGTSARQGRNKVLGATIWQPWCEAGPGSGGVGGQGGPGGPGGVGGTGGNGGNVTLISLPEHLPTLFQVIRVNQGGGPGGPGGAGGSGGSGGPGGPEGQLANFCHSAGRQGGSGGPGSSGPAGQNGEPGRAGQPFIAQLTTEQFATLFGF